MNTVETFASNLEPRGERDKLVRYGACVKRTEALDETYSAHNFSNRTHMSVLATNEKRTGEEGTLFIGQELYSELHRLLEDPDIILSMKDVLCR